METLEQRFWSKVERRGPDECWPWKRSRNPDGYGKFSVKYQDVRAHRMAYELTNGPLPPRTMVRHSCDNPPCCNPAHLLPGTSRDNIDDMVSRRRQARGSRSAHAKLTDDAVADIRESLGRGETQVSIAARHGVTQANVSIIKLGRGWKTP